MFSPERLAPLLMGHRATSIKIHAGLSSNYQQQVGTSSIYVRRVLQSDLTIWMIRAQFLFKRGCLFMRQFSLYFAVLLLFSLTEVGTSVAASKIVARIDLSQQRMSVYVKGRRQYSWPVSTARRGYRTPVGSFRPKVLKRMHYSRKYHNSPMPHSVFFLGGYAIHGTGAISRLGRRASHGCIRLHPGNARRLYSLIRAYGMNNTRIQVVR